MAVVSNTPDKNDIKPLCDCDDQIQDKLLTLAVKSKIILYMIRNKNGQLYPLHSGEVETIRCSGEVIVVIEKNRHPMPSEAQRCLKRHIWVNVKNEEELLADLSDSKNLTNVFSKYSTPLLDILSKAIEKFWLNHDSKKPPKQDEIITWLTAQSISAREAKAIDTIIRPLSCKNGGNKARNK